MDAIRAGSVQEVVYNRLSFDNPMNVALLEAARSGDVALVRTLLPRKDVNVYTCDGQCWSPLMIAAYYGWVEVVRVLLQHKDIIVTDHDGRGHTALMLAAANGHVETVQELLQDNDTPIDAQNENGWNALMFAAFFGGAEIVQILVNMGTTYWMVQGNSKSLLGCIDCDLDKIWDEEPVEDNLDLENEVVAFAILEDEEVIKILEGSYPESSEEDQSPVQVEGELLSARNKV